MPVLSPDVARKPLPRALLLAGTLAALLLLLGVFVGVTTSYPLTIVKRGVGVYVGGVPRDERLPAGGYIRLAGNGGGYCWRVGKWRYAVAVGW